MQTTPRIVSLAPMRAAMEALQADGDKPTANHVQIAAMAWTALDGELRPK
jgi:hypothetical protein